MRLAVIPLLAQALAAQTVTVTGTVTNAITRAPIPEATVVLISSGSPNVGRSGPDGTFQIQKLVPAKYSVMLIANGYSADPASVTIEAVKEPAALTFTMMPWPGLRGRVLDASLQPAAKVTVKATQAGKNNTYSATTDDRGQFVFERMNPGRYLLRAQPAVAKPAEDGTDVVATYYPDSPEESGAQAITVNLGSDLAGFEIVLKRVRVFSISGKVLDEAGKPAPGAQISCGTSPEIAISSGDGSFELKRVRAFDGWIRADLTRDIDELRGQARVVVAERNLEDVTIQVSGPMSVRGTAELDGKPVRISGDARLIPATEPQSTERGNIGDDGITFARVYPGRYRLELMLPPGLVNDKYVDSIELGGRDVTPGNIDVVPGMPPFRVVLKSDGGQVRGTVTGGSGDLGVVLLIPKEEALRNMPFLAFGIVSGGRYQIDNVRPGDYYAVAAQKNLQMSGIDDPATERRILDGAASVHVERHGSVTVDLKYLEDR